MITRSPKGYSSYANPLMNQFTQDHLRNLMQQISPHTTGAISQLGQMAGGQGDISNYKEQQMSDFQQNVLPQILQQFGSFGSGRGSGLNNALASATQGLGQNLEARREGLQSDAISQLLGLNSQLMGQRTHEYGLVQKPKSGLSSFLSEGVPNIAKILSSLGIFL